MVLYQFQQHFQQTLTSFYLYQLFISWYFMIQHYPLLKSSYSFFMFPSLHPCFIFVSNLIFRFGLLLSVQSLFYPKHFFILGDLGQFYINSMYIYIYLIHIPYV